MTTLPHIAAALREELAPHCHRIEIAGSIRRRKPDPRDIELVAIPKPYDVGLFASGIALVLGQYQVLKGTLPCKYTQRRIPRQDEPPVKLDFFTATPENWGLIFAIRTGSADYSHRLAQAWVARGYHSVNGMLHRGDRPIAVPEESDLFRICGMEYAEPFLRH